MRDVAAVRVAAGHGLEATIDLCNTAPAPVAGIRSGRTNATWKRRGNTCVQPTCHRSHPEDAHTAKENAVSQHLLTLTVVQLALVDRALTELETQLFPPASVDGDRQPDGDRDLPSAPTRHSGARLGLAKLDPVRERLQRLQGLAQQARDAEATLVNDALNWKANLLLQEATALGNPDRSGARPGPTQLLPA